MENLKELQLTELSISEKNLLLEVLHH